MQSLLHIDNYGICAQATPQVSSRGHITVHFSQQSEGTCRDNKVTIVFCHDGYDENELVL